MSKFFSFKGIKKRTFDFKSYNNFYYFHLGSLSAILYLKAMLICCVTGPKSSLFIRQKIEISLNLSTPSIGANLVVCNSLLKNDMIKFTELSYLRIREQFLAWKLMSDFN